LRLAGGWNGGAYGTPEPFSAKSDDIIGRQSRFRAHAVKRHPSIDL
jgi:hypothetical protein